MHAEDIDHVLEVLDGHYAIHRARFPKGLVNIFRRKLSALPDYISGELGRKIEDAEELILPAHIPQLAKWIVKARTQENIPDTSPPVVYSTPEKAKQLLRCAILEKAPSDKRREEWEKVFKRCDAKGITAQQMVQAIAGSMPGLDKYGFRPDEDPFADGNEA